MTRVAMHIIDRLLAEVIAGIRQRARLLSRGNVHTAEDLESEAIVACMRVFHRYSDRPLSELVSLAGRASNNAMIDYTRYLAYRNRPVMGEEELNAVLYSQEEQLNPADIAISRELLVALRAALSPVAREVLRYLVEEDDDGPWPTHLTASDIAKKLNVRQSAIYAAKAELRARSTEVFQQMNGKAVQR